MIDYDSSYNYVHSKFKTRIPPLMKTLYDAKFFSYIFIQKRKIKKWNSDSELIQFSSFGMQLKLTNGYKDQLEKIFIKHLLKLGKYIDEILNQGWKMSFLSIWEYNIIVNFKDFYDKYYQIFKEKEIIKKDFHRFEKAYVKVTYKQYYPDAIKSTFIKYLKTNNKFYEDNQEKYDDILNELVAFFDSDNVTRSIRKLIIAFHMVKHRNYYEWDDIFPPLKEDIVEKKYYNCSREVFESVLKYYTDLRETLDSLDKEKIELSKLKNNIDIGDNNDPPILVHFYEKLEHNWTMDKSNFYLLFLLIIKGLLDDLDSLIYKEWELLMDNETSINQYLIMDKELPHLYHKLKREHEIAFHHFNSDTSSAISIEDFLNTEAPELLLKSESQKKMHESFNLVLKSIYEISQILKAYGDIAIDTGYKTNQYFKYIFNSADGWIGKPVFALFNFYIELCWTICSFFNYETFKNLDGRLEDIKNARDKLIEEKGRIDKYNILAKAIKPVVTEVE